MSVICRKCGKRQSATATGNRDIFTLVKERKKHIFCCKDCAEHMLLKSGGARWVSTLQCLS